MPSIPEETIVAIREATDLVALVSEYVRDLKASGKHYKALSPFKSEKTPSFFVEPSRQTYHCYSSGEHGNCFTFLMKMESISFPEAVRQLGQRAGITVLSATADNEVQVSRDPLYRLNGWARDWFAARLRGPEGAQARDYLADRRFEDSSQENFALGWSPDTWEALLEAALKVGFAIEDLEATGLVVTKEEEGKCYDRFRGRIIFPILDARERVVGFGGRVLQGDDVKYVNTPETPVFHKSRHLYGLHLAARALRRDRTALLFEGYTDVIMAHQFGFDNAVAVLGTAFNEGHARLLKRWVDRVLLVLDGDEAGRQAAWRALPFLYGADLEVRLVLLPQGTDPCDLLTTRGEAAFRDLLQAAGDPVETSFAALPPVPAPDDVAQLVERLVPLIEKIPSPVRRELTLRHLSERSGLEPTMLQGRPIKQPVLRRHPTPVEPSSGESPVPAASGAERAVLGALIARPELVSLTLAELPRTPLSHPLLAAMVARLITHVQEHGPISGDLAEALFQEPAELDLALSCRQGAPAAEAERLLHDGLQRLKEERISVLGALAREARQNSDDDAARLHERLRYELTKDLKKPRPDTSPRFIRNA